MTMTASYPGMSQDPIRESQEIRRQSLAPTLRKLQEVLQDLEEYMGEPDHDDDGRRGD